MSSHVTDEGDGATTAKAVRREVYVDADLDPFQVVLTPDSLGLSPGQTVAQWVAEQKSGGETAYSLAKELDLFDGVTVTLQVVEYGDDGTNRCVDRATWDDATDEATP